MRIDGGRSGQALCALWKNTALMALALGAVAFVSPAAARPTLIGTTELGGEGGVGTVYAVPLDGSPSFLAEGFPGAPHNRDTDVFIAPTRAGFAPHPSNGLLYGVFPAGGAYSLGALAAFDPKTGSTETLWTFDDDEMGYSPMNAPTFIDEDHLIVVTGLGGANVNFGAMLSFDLRSREMTLLWVNGNGALTGDWGQPILATDGNIYVNLISGSAGGLVLFDPSQPTGPTNPTLLGRGNEHSVSVSQRGGILYGASKAPSTLFIPWTSVLGVLGGPDLNTGFNATGPCLDPIGTFSCAATRTVHTLCSGLPLNPAQSSIVRFASSSSNGQVLVHTFDGAPKRATWMTDGPLEFMYGLLEYDGALLGAPASGAQPEVFRFDTTSGTAVRLGTLPTSMGNQTSRMLTYHDGALYGVSVTGGALDRGVIYQAQLDGTFGNATSLGYSSGGVPGSGFRQAPDGKAYGFVWLQPLPTDGDLFSSALWVLDPATGQHTSEAAPLQRPAPPRALANGDLYGLGVSSSNGNAVIYKRNAADGTWSTEVDLGVRPGAVWQADVLLASDRLYFVFEQAVREHVYGTSTAPVVHDLTGESGEDPVLGLALVNTTLYGVTEKGGTDGSGVLFSYELTGGVYTEHHSFAGGGADAANPSGPLLVASDGLLYGLSTAGGSHDKGTLYSFDPASPTTAPVVHHSFDGWGGTGEAPAGSLLETSDGRIAGVATSSSQSLATGEVFAWSSTGGFTVLQSLDRQFGYRNPTPVLAELDWPVPPVPPVPPLDAGVPDAGTDAAMPDASTADAGTQDASAPDAMVMDAGSNGGPDGGSPPPVQVAVEPPGSNCAQGGTRIILPGQADQFVCGLESLVRVIDARDGDGCDAAGGYVILSGLDDGLPSGNADDGTLQDGEVEREDVICGQGGTLAKVGGSAGCSVSPAAGRTRGVSLVVGLALLALAYSRRRRGARVAGRRH